MDGSVPNAEKWLRVDKMTDVSLEHSISFQVDQNYNKTENIIEDFFFSASAISDTESDVFDGICTFSIQLLSQTSIVFCN